MRMDYHRGSAKPRIAVLPQSENIPDRNDGALGTGLSEVFQRYFDVLPADTRDLLDEALRLRYQVYCVEHSFENPDEHPDGREIDCFDGRSVHSVLRHRPSDSVVGTVRLILPNGSDLPVTAVCRMQLPSALPPERTAEISRFAISKKFRRRVEDRLGIDAALVDQARISDPLDRRVIPHMALGLMKAVVQMSNQHGVTHLVAVMEPALLRLLFRLGIIFQPMGPLVEYHGIRQPCCGEITTILDHLKSKFPESWKLIAG